jgi:MFS family permease
VTGLDTVVAAPEGSAAAVFRNRPFLLLWLSQLATQVGGNMVLYGLTVLVFDQTGSTSAVSLLILTFLVPAVLFSALAGVYVDRFDRRKVLVVTNIVRAGLFLLLALFDTNMLVVYGLNIAVSIATTFFAPAELSMIPRVVPKSQLTAANGIFLLTLNAAFAIGFALLGPLLVIAAPDDPHRRQILCPSPPASLTLPQPRAPRCRDSAVHEAEAAAGTFVEQLREGIAYVRANPVVSWALLYLGVAASIVGVLGVLGPAFARDVLGLRTQDFVIIVAPLGIGAVIGALGVNALRGQVSRRRLIETGLIVLGVCLALISIAGPIAQFLRDVDDRVPGPDMSSFVSVLSVVVAIALVAGIAYTATAIPAQTELQEEIPPAVRGRVFGILNMLVSVGSFLPIILVGYISDMVGTMPVLLGAAALIVVVGIASLVARASPPPGALSDERGESVDLPLPGIAGAPRGRRARTVPRRAYPPPRVAVVFTGGTISMTVDGSPAAQCPLAVPTCSRPCPTGRRGSSRSTWADAGATSRRRAADPDPGDDPVT